MAHIGTIALLTCSLAVLASFATANFTAGCGRAHSLYQFPLGSWLENIAVRSNGNLLLTRIDVPQIYQLNPLVQDAEPELVVNLPDVDSVFGIAEISADVFAFSTGNFSFQSGSVPQTWSIRQVDLSDGPKISKIAEVPTNGLLNGMTVLPATEPPHEVLSGDIGAGVIYRVSPATGSVNVAVNNSLTAAVSSSIGTSGVNGIRIGPSRPDVLYLANFGKHILASIEINPLTGVPKGEGRVIANITAPAGTFNFDDFALPYDLDEDDAAYIVTSAGNSIERIPLSGPEQGQRQHVAGDLNSTLIAQPTSAAFGRTEKDRHVLYVVTGGAQISPVNGDLVVGAQVLAIDVRGCRERIQGWGKV